MQLNTQPVEMPRTSPDAIELHSVWRTIQGEGPFAGFPATFVRLAGCNLRCPLCDTDYTSKRKVVTPDYILRLATELEPVPRLGTDLVVITGGEPFRQDISLLVERLLYCDFIVQVETNGTICPSNLPWGHPNFHVVCSPKAAKLAPEFVTRSNYLTALKYVVEDGYVAQDGLPLRVLGKNIMVARPPENYPRNQIYVQPLDEQDEARNKLHVAAAVRSCLEHGYCLCLQVHKLAGLE